MKCCTVITITGVVIKHSLSQTYFVSLAGQYGCHNAVIGRCYSPFFKHTGRNAGFILSLVSHVPGKGKCPFVCTSMVKKRDGCASLGI